MTKHVIDHPKGDTASRLARFMRIARQSGLHRASTALVRRNRDRAQPRLSHYLRIARGQQS